MVISRQDARSVYRPLLGRLRTRESGALLWSCCPIPPEMPQDRPEKLRNCPSRSDGILSLSHGCIRQPAYRRLVFVISKRGSSASVKTNMKKRMKESYGYG